MTKLINYLFNGEYTSLATFFLSRYETVLKNVVNKTGTFCQVSFCDASFCDASFCPASYCKKNYNTKKYNTNYYCTGMLWVYLWPNNPDDPEILRDNMPRNVPDAPDGSIDLVLIFSILVITGFVGYGIYKFFYPSPIPEIAKEAKPIWEDLRETLCNKFLDEHPGMLSKEILQKHLDVLHEILKIRIMQRRSVNQSFETFWNQIIDEMILRDFNGYMADMLYNEKQYDIYMLSLQPPIKPSVVVEPSVVIEPLISFPSSRQIEIFLWTHPLLVLVTLLLIWLIGFMFYIWLFESKR